MHYLAIAGNIGVGKTTLTRMLAQHYHWEPYLEPSIENPYLCDYYQDMPRWAFALEIYYLKRRFADVLNILHRDVSLIQDRTIFESIHVFAKNNYEQGNLNERDYNTFIELYQLMIHAIKSPDLLIYLQADVSKLVSQIQKRGRESEQRIQLDYLTGLNKRYEDFYRCYTHPKMIINMNDLDFEHRTEDFEYIVQQIDDRITSQLF